MSKYTKIKALFTFSLYIFYFYHIFKAYNDSVKEWQVNNMLDFVDINKDNIHNYCRFTPRFKGDIDHFQPSLYPKKSDFFAPMMANHQLVWSFLFHDGRIIGGIWLEKEELEPDTATMGIFISDKDRRSNGVGAEAVTRYIDLHKDELGISQVQIVVHKDNIRAINCFKKCGFECGGAFVDSDRIKKYTMIKKL